MGELSDSAFARAPGRGTLRTMGGGTDTVQRMRARLTAAGWTVRGVHSARAEGEPRVIRGTAQRGPLRATCSWNETFVPGSMDDRLESLGPLAAEQRVGAAMVRVRVDDTARACEELASLEALFGAPTLDAAIALVVARGFSVDSRECEEGEYDEFHRCIEARRAGEHMSIDYTCRGSRPPTGIVVSDLFANAQMQRGAFCLTVTLRSLAAAEEVLDVLTRPAIC